MRSVFFLASLSAVAALKPLAHVATAPTASTAYACRAIVSGERLKKLRPAVASLIAPLLEALGPVRSPGAVAAPQLGEQWRGLFPRAKVVSGTTDSNAAFIASGAAEEGDAVTSLGSAKAMKGQMTPPQVQTASGQAFEFGPPSAVQNQPVLV